MFGEYIRQKRKEKKLTQKQLGLLCGYPEASAERMVQFWERNEREVPLDKIRPLANALEIPIESLIP